MEKGIIKRLFKLRLIPMNASFEDTNVGPILSPFLTKDKINQFCLDFNENSKFYFLDLRLSVIFFLNTDNSFFYIIKGQRLSELLKLILNTTSLFKIDESFIFLTEFYDVIFYKYFFYNNFNCYKYNSFFFKLFLLNNLFSLKNFYVLNDYNFEYLDDIDSENE